MRKQKPSRLSSNDSNSTRTRAKRRTFFASPASHQTQRFRSKQQKRISLRAGLAVISGRAAGALSRRLHLGGGTSIVGIVAQRVYPDIVEHLAAQLEYGCVMITGTNGKTTTSSFIAAILRDAGLRVWQNREGSNLMRGIASSLIIRALPNGQLRRSGKALSVLEVDEAVLPQVVQRISPRVIVFTNLFRDQLDRYGEVDSVLNYWQEAIRTLSADTTLVLNADDPAIAALGESFAGRILYYGIDDLSLDIDKQEQTRERHQAIDTRTCPRCGSDYIYDARFYSHMGHYHCSHCDFQRPQPDVKATQVQTDSIDRLRVQVVTPGWNREITISLPGLYNVYNALAATTAAQALGIHWEPIITGIEQSKPVFGRGERIQAEGRTIRLLLAKNPTGFNEVLRTLFSDGTPRHVMFVLNDNIADGRDISWIWDVDFERTIDSLQTVVVAGTRTLDLALRLKYAGVAQESLTIIPSTPLRTSVKEEATSRRSRQPSRTRLFARARQERSDLSTSETVSHTTDMADTDATNAINATASKRPIATIFGLKNALNRALEQTPVGETLFIIPTYTGLLEVHRELSQRGFTSRYWEGGKA